MSSLLSNRTAFLSLVLFSSLLLVIPSIYQSARINNWSLHYFQGTYQGEQQEPATGHPRGEIWQALSALSSQDWLAAIDLLSPLAMQGNKYGIELLGRAFEGAGNYSAAFQAYRDVGNSQGLMRVAATATQLGDLNTAHEAYYAAWEIDPNKNTIALVNFLLMNLNEDPASAETILSYSLNKFPLSPYRPKWWALLGKVLNDQGRIKEAEEVYREVIAEKPEDWWPYIALGWLDYEKQDSEKALAQFQRAIELGAAEEGYKSIGNLLFRQKKYSEADEWYRKAIELRPKKQSLYLQRANAAQKAGNVSLALEVYQDAIARFPNNSSLYYEVAELHLENGQIERAIEAVEHAIELDSLQSKYFALAGYIYSHAGDMTKALKNYRQALQLDPGNNSIQKAIEKLQN